MNRILASGIGLALVVGPLTASASATDAAPSARQAPYKVSAKINHSVAIVGKDTIKVRGKVTPRAAGQKVILQQRMEDNKKWAFSSKAKIKKSGRYLLKDNPTAKGTRYYRVLKPGGHGVKKGTSEQLQVQVYKWESLVGDFLGPTQNATVGYAFVAGGGHQSSASTDVAGTPTSLEFTLGRNCTTLLTDYALNDRSASGATGSVTVTTDGVVKDTLALALGRTVAMESDLSGVYRLRLDLGSNLTPASYVSMLYPRILCTA